jgi:predicted component of type VI protein secretion system
VLTIVSRQHLSSVHCQISRDRISGVTFVEDRSINGTFVNGVQLGKVSGEKGKKRDAL